MPTNPEWEARMAQTRTAELTENNMARGDNDAILGQLLSAQIALIERFCDPQVREEMRQGLKLIYQGFCLGQEGRLLKILETSILAAEMMRADFKDLSEKRI